RRRHTRFSRDWSPDVCSSDLRKIKKLIDLLEESDLTEIEIKEGEESVRLSRLQRGTTQFTAAFPSAPPQHEGVRAIAADPALQRSGERRVGQASRPEGAREHQ